MAAFSRLYFRLLSARILNSSANCSSMFSRRFAVSSSSQKSTNELTAEQYWVCRQKGTEPPWSGEYVHCNATGVYHCVCCGTALFSSSTKFDSGSGWPSFYAPLHDNKSTEKKNPDSSLPVTQREDLSHGMVRVEALCKKCDAHLGHMFPDGPPPTGLRYCINSVALTFKKTEHE